MNPSQAMNLNQAKNLSQAMNQNQVMPQSNWAREPNQVMWMLLASDEDREFSQGSILQLVSICKRTGGLGEHESYFSSISSCDGGYNLFGKHDSCLKFLVISSIEQHKIGRRQVP